MTAAPSPARAPYDELADVYDLVTGSQRHGPWLRSLLALARRHGVHGRSALDVACGTGSSFLPLLELGFDVTGCDHSAAMLARARARAGRAPRLVRADMRSLPPLGSFDLVTCLNDSVNHLTSEADVVAALSGMRANLDRDGVLVFDVLLEAAFATAGDAALEDGRRFVVWRGSQAQLERPGAEVQVVIEVFEHAGEGWRRRTWRLVERHYPLERVEAMLRTAGLTALDVVGQRPGGVLDGPADESRHHKAVVLAGIRP